MKKPVILCVDDEKMVLSSLKEQLKRGFGTDYTVDTAENAKDALDIFQELREDNYEVPLVIADYIMPDVKGDELLRQINDIAPETRKIMLTGQASIEGVTNAVNEANLYRYIAKPWEHDDLVLTVGEAIRSYFQDKQIEDQNNKLRESEEKYRGIFENAIEGIFQSTAEGRFMSANPTFARILGYDSPQELIDSVTDIRNQFYVIPERRDEMLQLIKEKKTVRGFEVEHYRKDKSKIWVSLNIRAVFDKDDNILFLEGFLEDVTVRREKEKAEREREIAEAANKKIMDSIRYAKMIQSSLLPNPESVKTCVPDSFFIWMPRDIVGGDFIFTDISDSSPACGDSIILAVVDCTGHGVPGAFMTMIASAGLNRIIKDEGCRNPAEILKHLNMFVKKTLQQDTAFARSDDGLDAAIISVQGNLQSPSQHLVLTFSGAKLPLVYVHEGEVNVIKGNRQSIGYKRSDLNYDFTTHTIDIKKGMCFYMYSDGVIDQMGGDKRRLFGSRRFRELAAEISSLSFEKQQEAVLQRFYDYKGDNEQQDDVTVVGFGF